jgi:hypothetical protein
LTVEQKGVAELTDRAAVRDAVIAGLAEVFGVSPEHVEEQICFVGGDNYLELDSKTEEFGSILPTPVEMGREDFSTIGALVAAIAAALGIAE